MDDISQVGADSGDGAGQGEEGWGDGDGEEEEGEGVEEEDRPGDPSFVPDIHHGPEKGLVRPESIFTARSRPENIAAGQSCRIKTSSKESAASLKKGREVRHYLHL